MPADVLLGEKATQKHNIYTCGHTSRKKKPESIKI
jgi:hypothetical protein